MMNDESVVSNLKKKPCRDAIYRVLYRGYLYRWVVM
jgi:hypothetical protein